MAVALRTSSNMDTKSQKKIPLINSVLADKDFNRKDPEKRSLPKLVAPSLSKIIKLLLDKHSRKLIDRHKNAIKRYTTANKDGFFLKDFKTVTTVLKICAEYCKTDDSYGSSICEILACLRKPFLKEKLSDEEVYLETTSSCITDIGEIALMCSEGIQREIAVVVSSLFNLETKRSELSDIQPVSSHFLKAMIEKSTICRSLAKCYGLTTDLETRLELAYGMRNMSESRLNCDDMLFASAAGLVCSTLNMKDPSNRLLFLCVEMLWNLLEFGSEDDVVDQLNCDECINALQIAFLGRLQSCCGHADRQLRNDLLILSLLVAAHCPGSPFIETGYAKNLALLASFPEVQSNSELVKIVKIQQNHEDFELKKLLFDMALVLSKDPASLPVMSEQRVVLALLSYVRPIDASLKTSWTPAQYEELQLQALCVLSAIAPLLIDDYITCQGNTRLLLLLEWCIGPDDYGGHGNSYYGVGGRGNKRAQMRYCIRLLRSVCSHGDEGVLSDLSDQNAIGELVGILHNASASTDENDSIDIEMQCDMLFTIACLCDGDLHRKELFGEFGVDMLINYFRNCPDRIVSPLGHHRLMLATVDCVWASIVGCYANEVIFMEKEGIFLLFDLLEVCPENMQNLVLGAVNDICENMKALPHARLWRGENDATIGQLLLKLWQHEEANLGISRDPSGVIIDSLKPIMSTLQASQGIIPLPSSCPSPAIVDVSENIRAKIYSFFCKLGFNNVPGLKTPDYISLSIIERYLEFKTLEVWIEIRSELEQEGIRPVSPDRDCMDHIIEALEERVTNVASVQKLLVEAENSSNLVDEEVCYEKIKESHKQVEKRIKDFTDFLQRTSDYDVLQQARQNQLEMIAHSRLCSSDTGRGNDILHETNKLDVATTSFCGRSIVVKSTPPEFTRKFIHENKLLREMEKEVMTMR